MDAETQLHIFEPFFTTKEVGKGTGLGLSTVYGVVKQSEGFIWVHSTPGQGTAFRIYLPGTTAPESRKLSGSADGPCGEETILLVEDAQNVRELTREWLTASGYKVLEAQCGEDAIRLFEKHRPAIDLLLTDVIMPGMDGPGLAEKLARMQPEVKVLFASGYMGFLEEKRLGSAAVLAKPFTRDALLRKLREILAAELATAT